MTFTSLRSSPAFPRAVAINTCAALISVLLLSCLLEAGATTQPARLLHEAGRGDAATVVRLLRDGADVDARDHEGRTALHVAAHAGNMEAVEFLILYGADVNARQRDGRDPLHHAAAMGRLGAVNLLIANGAVVDAKDRNGVTPLGWALMVCARNDIVLRLIKKGAAVNDDFGRYGTPILIAIEQDELELVRTLTDHGADLNAADSKARTPLAWARRYASQEVVDLLIARGAKD